MLFILPPFCAALFLWQYLREPSPEGRTNNLPLERRRKSSKNTRHKRKSVLQQQTALTSPEHFAVGRRMSNRAIDLSRATDDNEVEATRNKHSPYDGVNDPYSFGMSDVDKPPFAREGNGPSPTNSSGPVSYSKPLRSGSLTEAFSYDNSIGSRLPSSSPLSSLSKTPSTPEKPVASNDFTWKASEALCAKTENVNAAIKGGKNKPIKVEESEVETEQETSSFRRSNRVAKKPKLYSPSSFDESKKPATKPTGASKPSSKPRSALKASSDDDPIIKREQTSPDENHYGNSTSKGNLRKTPAKTQRKRKHEENKSFKLDKEVEEDPEEYEKHVIKKRRGPMKEGDRVYSKKKAEEEGRDEDGDADVSPVKFVSTKLKGRKKGKGKGEGRK